MKIEAGKYYRTRDGRKVGPMDEYIANKFCDIRGNGYWWDKKGIGQHNALGIDLIEEWSETMMEPSTGMKYDSGKAIAGVLFDEFPNALSGVSDISTFGANKYTRSSWQTVDNAYQRYSDAFVRHMLAKGKGEVNDPESGMPHSWHIAWNALALIELEAKANAN